MRAFWFCLLMLTAAGLRLVYGAYNPSLRRFWDERYALMNVRSILEEHTLKPAKSYYPSPVFNLPAATVVAVADRLDESISQPETNTDALPVYEEGFFGPRAFLLVRWLQGLTGVLAVGLAFRVGRRLAGLHAAWIASAMVAFMPWNIHAGGIFKPDSLVVATVLFAFDRSLSAVRQPTWIRFVVVGFAVSLAMSSKLTGALIAVPVMVGCVWPGAQWRQRMTGLVVAGASTLACFFALNPYGFYYLKFLSALKEDYKLRTAVTEGDWWSVLKASVSFPMDSSAFGPVLGLLCLLGFLFLVGKVALGAMEPDRRRDFAMLLAYPPVFAAVYAAQTPYFKSNNFLPLIPFVAIAFAQVLVVGLRRLQLRWHLPLPALGVWVIVCASLLPGTSYLYESVLPTTYDKALLDLKRPLSPKLGRTVLVESQAIGGRLAWEGRANVPLDGMVAIREVDSLDQLPPHEVNQADALVFARRKLEADVSPESNPYQRWASAPKARLLTVEPEFLTLRGPELAMVDRRFRPRKPVVVAQLQSCPDAEKWCWLAVVDDRVAAGDSVSLALDVLHSRAIGYQAPVIEVDGKPIAVWLASTRTKAGTRWISERFAWPSKVDRNESTGDESPANVTVRLSHPLKDVDRPSLKVVRWFWLEAP